MAQIVLIIDDSEDDILLTKMVLSKLGWSIRTEFALSGEEGLQKFSQLIRTYFKLGGHHVQFNVLSSETLKAAQLHPEEYQDLIVRVAGYSDYFVRLSRDLQNEIISRTEHGWE